MNNKENSNNFSCLSKNILVKICANKTIEDAKMCITAKADFLGVLVGQNYNSTDFISKEQAKEIVDFVNKRISCVLVTHLTKASEIIKLSKFIGNDFIQLHSNIDESEVKKIKRVLPDIKLIRLIHISKNGEIETNYKNFRFVDYYLLDSFNKQTHQVGGTGIVHNWNTDKELIKKLNKPTFIAGGLNPDNVASVIKIANPAGVDVNSGCKLDGVKNEKLVTSFVQNAKNIF